jgi:hypothetical protein
MTFLYDTKTLKKMAVSTAEIVLLIIAIVLNVVSAVWLFFANSGLNNCEKKESDMCPFITCPTSDPTCGSAAFRFDNGKKVCMVPATAPATVKTTGTLNPPP